MDLNINENTENAEEKKGSGKPRLAEALGVDVEEVWNMKGSSFLYKVGKDGQLREEMNGNWIIPYDLQVLVDAINHPERIEHSAKWTEKDVENAKALMKIFDHEFDPTKIEVFFNTPDSIRVGSTDTHYYYYMPDYIIPSMRYGDRVLLSKIIG